MIGLGMARWTFHRPLWLFPLRPVVLAGVMVLAACMVAGDPQHEAARPNSVMMVQAVWARIRRDPPAVAGAA